MKFLLFLSLSILLLSVKAAPTHKHAKVTTSQRMTTANATILPKTYRSSHTGSAIVFMMSGTGGDNCVPCAVENFNLVNDHRNAAGLNDLAWSNDLTDLAEAWSWISYTTEIPQAPPFGTQYTENFAWSLGWLTWETAAQGFFDIWINNAIDDAQMKNPNLKCMGVGIYGDGSKFYATQLFSEDC